MLTWSAIQSRSSVALHFIAELAPLSERFAYHGGYSEKQGETRLHTIETSHDVDGISRSAKAGSHTRRSKLTVRYLPRPHTSAKSNRRTNIITSTEGDEAATPTLTTTTFELAICVPTTIPSLARRSTLERYEQPYPLKRQGRITP